MKYLGALAWIGFVYALAAGNGSIRAQAVAGCANFLLFFHRDLWQWTAHPSSAWPNQA